MNIHDRLRHQQHRPLHPHLGGGQHLGGRQHLGGQH